MINRWLWSCVCTMILRNLLLYLRFLRWVYYKYPSNLQACKYDISLYHTDCTTHLIPRAFIAIALICQLHSRFSRLSFIWVLLWRLWLIMAYSKWSTFIGWIEVYSAKVEEYEAQSWLAMSPEKERGAECEAVTNFREYLRIPSVQPDVNYGMWYWNLDVIIRQTYY